MPLILKSVLFFAGAGSKVPQDSGYQGHDWGREGLGNNLPNDCTWSVQIEKLGDSAREGDESITVTLCVDGVSVGMLVLPNTLYVAYLRGKLNDG